LWGGGNGDSQSTLRATEGGRPYESHSENHPVPKRRDLGFELVSHSENHPVFLPIFDWQKATPPREGKYFAIRNAGSDARPDDAICSRAGRYPYDEVHIKRLRRFFSPPQKPPLKPFLSPSGQKPQG
jgi:hypothetical protein